MNKPTFIKLPQSALTWALDVVTRYYSPGTLLKNANLENWSVSLLVDGISLEVLEQIASFELTDSKPGVVVPDRLAILTGMVSGHLLAIERSVIADNTVQDMCDRPSQFADPCPIVSWLDYPERPRKLYLPNVEFASDSIDAAHIGCINLVYFFDEPVPNVPTLESPWFLEHVHRIVISCFDDESFIVLTRHRKNVEDARSDD